MMEKLKIKSDHLIKLNGTFNTRDLGGYSTISGKIIKSKRLLRSDDLYKLTSSDINVLVDDYHLNTIIDFRNSNERQNDLTNSSPEQIIIFYHLMMKRQLLLVAV